MSNKSADLSSYVNALRRRRYVLLAAVIPVVLAGLLLAFGLPNKYTSVALFRFERTVMSEYMGGAGGYVDQYVTSLSESVLGSKSLLRMAEEARVSVGAGLDEDDRVKALRKAATVKMIAEKILDPRDGRDRPVFSSFSVAYVSRDADESARAADWLAREFVHAARIAKQRPNETTTRVLTAEAERFRTNIAALEKRMAVFKEQNIGQLPEIANTNLGTIERSETELQSVEAQITSLRRERALLAGQLVQASNPDAGNLAQLEEEYRRVSSLYDPSHPDVISLRRQVDAARRGGGASGLAEQLSAQRAALAEAQLRYSPDHPDVRRITRDIQALEARIASGEGAIRRPVTAGALQVQSQINAVDSQLASLNARAAELRLKLRATEQRVRATPEVEREYQIITRDLASAREKYDALTREQMDKEIATASVVAGGKDEFSLVQQPVAPLDASAPKRAVILIVALMLAAMVGLMAVTVAELGDSSVRGIRDIESMLGMTALAAIPAMETRLSVRVSHRKLIFIIAGAIAFAVCVFAAVRSVVW